MNKKSTKTVEDDIEDDAPAADIPATPPMVRPVVARCGEPGCMAEIVEACEYVDSRGRACRTHWCSKHGSDVAGHRYCRRHAGTIAALGSKANNPRALPDVGHRGASLVRWVYRDLDPAMTRLLGTVSRPTEHVLRDTEVAVGRDAKGARYWEMTWKLASHSGVRMRIALRVEEKDDAMVHVRVGEEVLASGMPPWIEARRQGRQLTEEEDREQRVQFYTFLEEYLTEAIRPI